MKAIHIKSIASFAILTGLLISCTPPETQEAEASSPKTDKVQTVAVVNPQQRSFKAEILITGTAQPNQVTAIHSMESGMLQSLRKDIGDQVKQGETIAQLSNPELAQQRMKLQAELNAKQTAFERLNSVYQQTPALTTIQMLETAQAEFESAKASMNAIDHRISFLTIKAPFSGTITKRYLDKGSLVQSGLNQSNPQAIVEIQEDNPIRLTLPVPEADALAVKPGQTVEVNFPEMPGATYTAKISRISNALDPMSKTMQAEIDLDNADGKIVTGMYAKVRAELDSRDNILSLPVTAKISYKNESYVLAVEDGVVVRIPVKAGLTDADYFEVLNAEITDKTQVITTGKGLVKAGQRVEPQLTRE